MPVNLYQSDVAAMSDAELAHLSDELREAYECDDPEDDYPYWTDDDAEARYREMAKEVHRRFLLANPSWTPPDPEPYVKAAMSALANNLCASVKFARFFDSESPKVGDSVQVRMPVRFYDGGVR